MPYQPVLIDAVFAGLLSGAADAPLVIPALNRDGDLLSDFVLLMFGSIAGAESLLLAFHDDLEVKVAMAEAPHGGTAPPLQGKDVANPIAMLLAAATVLEHGGAPPALRAIREAVLESTAEGVRTVDLAGDATTSGFTTAVIEVVHAELGGRIAADRGDRVTARRSVRERLGLRLVAVLRAAR